jgi:K+-sensing histidine kinase KdpD
MPDEWSGQEKICVCLPDNPLALYLVRSTKRIAERRDAKWVALYIQDESTVMSESLKKAFNLTEMLGGETKTIVSSKTLDSILDYVNEEEINEIILGQGSSKLGNQFTNIFFPSLPHALIKNIQGKTIRILCPPKIIQVSDHSITARFKNKFNFLFLIQFCFLFTALLTYAFFASSTETSYIILVLITLTSIAFGYKKHVQAKTSQTNEKNTKTLYSLNRKLLGPQRKDSLILNVKYLLEDLYPVDAIICLYEQNKLLFPHHVSLRPEDKSVADWVFHNHKPAGPGENTFPGNPWLFYPLIIENKCIGVIGIIGKNSNFHLSTEEKKAFSDLINDSALALSIFFKSIN